MSLKVAVIGAGPAGYPAALIAAKLGAEVTVVEKARPGGVCLHSGCIPSKSLLDAAHRFDALRDIARLCEEAALPQIQGVLKELSWQKIQQRQQNTTNKLASGISGLFRRAKIDLWEGTASFENHHALKVMLNEQTRTLPFDYVIIAAGTEAFVPPPLDKIGRYVYDNSTIFQIPALPKSLTIVGGGAIGCEFATLMSSLGVQVNLIEMQAHLLPAMDENVSRLIEQSLQKRGVSLFLGTSVSDARVENDKKILTLNDGRELQSDAVLAAIGRRCDLTDLAPEKVGLTWDRKGLHGVNPQTLQVSENIYAAGDVTGLNLLAHAATRQGEVAAHNICQNPMTYYNDRIPSAVYTVPETAFVGLTRAQAQRRGLNVCTHKAFMAANGRALTQDAAEGFVEIVSEKDSDKLLGAVLVCPNASEIISAFTVALEAQFTIQRMKQVVFPHPTVSEAVADALAK